MYSWLAAQYGGKRPGQTTEFGRFTMRRVVYFIGAGFSKSLQATKPVPMLNDFCNVAAELCEDDVVLTALAQIETAQLHKIRVLEAEELGSRLSREPRNPIDRDRFKELMRRRPPESIEEMLDRAASNETLFVRFCYMVERLFYLVGWDIDWVALDAFLARRFSLADTQHIFVSFNYDLFLDRAVQRFGARQDESGSAWLKWSRCRTVFGEIPRGGINIIHAEGVQGGVGGSERLRRGRLFLPGGSLQCVVMGGLDLLEFGFEVVGVEVGQGGEQKFLDDGQEVVERAHRRQGSEVGSAQLTAGGGQQERVFDGEQRNPPSLEVSGQAPVFPAHSAQSSRSVAIHLQNLTNVQFKIRAGESHRSLPLRFAQGGAVDGDGVAKVAQSPEQRLDHAGIAQE